MDTEHTPTEKPKAPPPKRYVFAKTCTNDHGRFVKGDKARGAFAPDLVAAYVAAGILIEAPRV